MNESGPTLTIQVGLKLNEVEKLVIDATLRHTAQNISRAARILGIDRSTMYEKIKEYRLRRR
jgi:DNA-binding NtrC family response regulator